LRLGDYPNLCCVVVETDEGLAGAGESFFGARATAEAARRRGRRHLDAG
jgi:hypothetical protein